MSGIGQDVRSTPMLVDHNFLNNRISWSFLGEQRYFSEGADVSDQGKSFGALRSMRNVPATRVVEFR